MRYTGHFSPALKALFDEYEFNSLKRFLEGRIEASGETLSSASLRDLSGPPEIFDYREAPLSEVLNAARKSGKLGLVTEAFGEGIFSGPRRIVLASGGLACAVNGSPVPAELKAVLEDEAIGKYGVDLKKQSHWLRTAGVELKGRWNDIQLMHYVLNPERSHELAALAQTLLGVQIEEEAAATTGSLFDEAPEADAPSRLKEAAVLVPLGEKLQEGLPGLYESMEEPLSKVLARMESAGVKVDLSQLRAFADGLRKELSAREAEIRELAGEPALNISSPKQVGDLLFEKLQLDPKAKKSARGQYTTDEATLLTLIDRHPIVDQILEFRAVKKLLSTYIEPFPSYVSEVDGRVHTTFNQALTATGRLSSSNPNLQNIPIRTERGKEIRKAFVPGVPGGVILSADYSQIELRIMAHLSCDDHLTQAFRNGQDVHAATAAKIFRIPVEEVTREQRGMAKTANFGIMYGISSFGLAQRLHLSRSAAKELIEGYFASFPAIRSFIDDSIAFARANGYVETLFGRRRYLPDINARNATVRALAERNAVNAPIQGTSADIIKLAMIGVDRKIREAGLASRMVLQIHDELLFDAIPEEVPRLQALVTEVMENVIQLSVPLTVECGAGVNWLEAH